MTTQTKNPTKPGYNDKTWVFGKVSQDWYIASGYWDEGYAKRLQALGYQVARSTEKPKEAA